MSMSLINAGGLNLSMLRETYLTLPKRFHPGLELVPSHLIVAFCFVSCSCTSVHAVYIHSDHRAARRVRTWPGRHRGLDRTRSSHASTRSSRSGKTKLLPASRPRFIQSIVGTTALSSIIRIVACERTSIIDSRGNNQPRTSTTSRFVLF
jgi:hypothetical protein